MADSPVASESLVKKEPEAVQVHDPIVSRSTSGIILLSALLLTISLAWALWDEAFGQRPWKGIQQEFVSRYTRYLRSIKPRAGQTETQVKESPEYQALDEEAKAAQEQVKPEIAEIDQKVGHIDAQLAAVTDPFQNQRGHLTVITYNLETATPSAKDRYRRQIERKRQEVVPVELPTPDGKISEQRMNYEQLEKLYNDLRDEKAELLGKKAELLKGPAELAKKRDDYLRNHLIGLGPNQIDGLIRKMENFDYSILGHQISIDSGRVVDRCEVCHIAIREPLTIKAADMAPDGPGKTPDSLARAFVSHPKRELLEIHKPERFGCSGCHWGNGRATTSEVKGHGRHRFWLWPLFQKENMEAGCQQCHAKDRVTQGADTLNLGRDLFNERGCVGCHRYEGFDRETDALNGTRQLITQLDDQVTANEKQIREETQLADDPNTNNDEVPKLRAHAESLRVANSLLAARKDQLNLQSKYLMQDQKKVGPNLKDVRLKLRKEWIPLWLRDPQGFRPGTKMPTFWRFSKPDEHRFVQPDKDADDQVRAISAYLWQESFGGTVPEQARGDAAKGKELFENRGCLACHSIGEGTDQMGGDFAANLQKVGEKSNFSYIVRWIHNPRERWAPYCPKEKRDLTPEDYSRHNKPYVFDTELNSRCPNDGTELQVQNMTVMPNFRLSDADARDIATYLFSRSAPPSYEDASFMDDPNLKAKGHALIKQYGCAGCHEIKGFEEEQRIGKELTVEGATPIERLDFALLTHDAMQGHDPLHLHGEHDERPWYNHKGFFERKLWQPSIYDKDKEKDPKDKLRMPEPYLKPEWRTALTTFLLGSVANEGANVPTSFFYDPEDQRRQDVQNGWWVIKKYNCMGCHQLQVGQRSVLMDVPIYETPEGKDFLPPRLTSEGARVDPNWLLRFLSDPSLSSGNGNTIFAQPTPAQSSSAATITASAQAGASPPQSPGTNVSQPAGAARTNNTAQAQLNGKLKPQPGLDRNGVRPYLKARMPTFNFSPNELQILVRFFMAMSGQQEPYIKEPLQPLTEQEKLVARQMFTSGTPCLKCHITGDPGHDATAIAPNFVLAPDRLKPDWTFRWLLDPAQISPGTAMPSGLFRKEGERWVINLPNPPASANAYMQDHAQLLVRYMLLMTPEEQRRLLATPPAQPASTSTQARAGKKRSPNTQVQSRRRKRIQTATDIRGSTSEADRAKVALKNILIWRI